MTAPTDPARAPKLATLGSGPSKESGKLLSIHVERFNPALRLYGRLGFREAEDKVVYLLMQRAPDPARFS